MGQVQRGYTIADSLIALAIVVVASVGLVGVVPYSFDQTQHSAIDVQADAAGQQFLDQIRYDVERGLPVPASTTAPIDFGETFRSPGDSATANATTGNFNLSGTCTVLTGPSRDCTVIVTWTIDDPNNAIDRSLTLETYVTSL